MPTASSTDFAALDPPSIQEARGVDSRRKMRLGIIKGFLKWAKKENWSENIQERLVIKR